MRKILVINDIITQTHTSIIEDIKYDVCYEIENNQSINDLIKEKYSPVMGHKLYINADCTIPRFKTKDFCQKYRVSITRDKDKADAVFVSDEFFDKYIKQDWGTHISVSNFENHIKKTSHSHNIKVIAFRKFLQDENIDVLFLPNYDCRYKFDDNGFDMPADHSHFKLCKKSDYDMIGDMLKNNKTYHQDDLLQHLNDNVVLNEDTFKQLKMMLQSRDNSNIKLAMEIMANSKYDESAPFILLLFKEYGESMWNSGFRNHVNFKSLVKFFGLDGRRSYYRCDLDDIVDILRAKKFLTEEAIAKFMPIAFEEISDYVSHRHFKVSKIDFVENPEEESDEEVLNIEEEDPAF